MRTWSKFVLIASLSLSPALASAATGGPFGLGVIVGEPTGLTSQLQLGQNRAVNSGLTYSFDDWFFIYSDYIFKMPGFFRDLTKSNTRLTAYAGLGGALGFDDRKNRADDIFLGVRFPLGGEYFLAEAPIGLFFELVPGLQLVEDMDFFLQGGVGVRYFF